MIDLTNTYYEKTCPKCGETKGPESFSRNSNSRDGLASWCNDCSAANYVKRHKERRASDPLYREITCQKGALRKAMRSWADGKTVRNSSRISEDLGVPADVAKVLIEARMVPGMTWENYGKGPGRRWEIDHVIPWASVRNWEQLADVASINNVYPMWKEDNRLKSSAGVKRRSHRYEEKL